MVEIKYDELVHALPKTELRPAAASPLKLESKRAGTFVPPTLSSTEPNALKASVLVICAPAAVGKSMLASALSSDARLPVLDLAVVPVATGSLRSCLGDLGPDGEVHFTSGKLAFLIDALDEGRLLSGDPSFRAFLVSAAPLLAGAAGPRVVLLGRPESGERAIEVLREATPHITVARLDLSFFDEASARRLVTSYADQEAAEHETECAAYTKHRTASGDVINAYFAAIAKALGVNDSLWTDGAGRALAGYAPVLAALGTLLARLDNFQAVAQALQKEGGPSVKAEHEPWGVIEKVVRELLRRERVKQCKNLIEGYGDAVSKELFDEEEQLALVAQHVVGQPRLGTGRLKLEKGLRDAYLAMVEQQLPEHPFVHDGHFRNQVFASIALAAEIRRGALTDEAHDELALVSRQPFLWRSFVRSDKDGALIDGAFLGYLLDSFWSDPVRAKGNVTFKPEEDVYVDVSVPGTANPVTVVVPPIVFFGQVVDVDIDMPSLEVRFDGRSLKGQGSQFTLRRSKITCGSVDFRTQNLVLDGENWLSADTLVQSPTQIRVESGAEAGWGGALGNRRPFREVPPTVQDPHRRVRARGLEALLVECVHRKISSTIVVAADYSLADSESGGPLTWMKAEHEPTLQGFLGILVKHGAAKKTERSSKGTIKKINLHMNVTWDDLLDEYRRLVADRDAQTPHRQLLVEAMQELR